MNEELNLDEVTKFVLEIQERIKFLSSMFPQNKENKDLLKSLAAASIHMTIFIRDLYNMTNGITHQNEDEYVKEFLSKCGCSESKDLGN